MEWKSICFYVESRDSYYCPFIDEPTEAQGNTLQTKSKLQTRSMLEIKWNQTEDSHSTRIVKDRSLRAK